MRNIPYTKSSTLSCPHGFFTRQGGISQDVFCSLNVHLERGDRVEHVLYNRKRVAETLKFQDIVFLQQTHSDIIHVLDHPPINPLIGDALIATNSGFCVAIQTADCVPILLQGDIHVAAIHAGWRGAVQKIVQKTLEQMKTLGNTTIHAAIGPHIHWTSYEVKDDIASQTEEWIIQKNQKTYLDLTRMVIAQLKGVDALDISHENTYENEKYFSCRRSFHRNEESFGAQASVIGLYK